MLNQNEIYDAIMEHRLPPRTKLTEHALCEIYATARHTVRKVFSQLAADGRSSAGRASRPKLGLLIWSVQRRNASIIAPSWSGPPAP